MNAKQLLSFTVATSTGKGNPTVCKPVRPKHCRCDERAWHDGDGTCLKCGKQIRNP